MPDNLVGMPSESRWISADKIVGVPVPGYVCAYHTTMATAIIGTISRRLKLMFADKFKLANVNTLGAHLYYFDPS